MRQIDGRWEAGGGLSVALLGVEGCLWWKASRVGDRLVRAAVGGVERKLWF